MRKHILIAMTVIFVLALATVAMAGDPFVGTWKADLTKSQYGTASHAPKSLILRIVPLGTGLNFERDRIDAEGKESHDSQSVNLDGKDYPIPGSSNGETFSSTRLDPNNMTWVIKSGGRQVQLWRSVVAKDGKTMTVTVDGKNAKGEDSHTMVFYDKQ